MSPRVRRLAAIGVIGPILAFVAIVAIYVSPWYSGTSGDAERPGDVQPVAVVIEQGDSLSAAAGRLEEAGVISSAQRFALLARVLGGGEGIKAGEYAFHPGDRWSQHMATMQAGRGIQRLVVIPEGTPSVLVQERLMAVAELTGEVAVPEEGSVLPGGYAYRRGETRAAVLERMQAAMRDTLARLWAERRPDIAVSTPAEAVILASIVEKETGKAEERRMVAGVYTNRLRIGMPLQADPTVIYPVTRGRPLGRRILRSELQADNGYNTYARSGLPIGPIANPGRESIAAVLNPETTRNLYFVADGTGGHIFAETLEQHNANVARWYALRRQRGEM